MKAKITGIIFVVLIVCVQTGFARDRGQRQADADSSYANSGITYGATPTNLWTINGTNFGMGKHMLLRNNLNGRLWTTFFYANGDQAYDASNSVTANALSMMDNIGLATNDTALNWDVAAVGDVNGDGRDDALITKTVSGQTYKKVLFFTDNGTVSSASSQWQNGSQWAVEGMGLFSTTNVGFKSNAQSQQVLLRNTSNGRLWMTFIGTNGSQYYNTNDFTGDTMSMMNNIGLATNDSALNWTVDAIGDSDGDGKDEVLIGKTIAGDWRVKKLLFFADNGIVRSYGAEWQNATKWTVEGMGVFDNVGHACQPNTAAQQVLLRNNLNGNLWMTYIGTNGTQYYSTNDFTNLAISQGSSFVASGDSALNWAVQAIGDVNADGKDEVLISRSYNGQLLKKVLFFGDNGIVSTNAPQFQNGTKWIIKGMRSK